MAEETTTITTETLDNSPPPDTDEADDALNDAFAGLTFGDDEPGDAPPPPPGSGGGDEGDGGEPGEEDGEPGADAAGDEPGGDDDGGDEPADLTDAEKRRAEENGLHYKVDQARRYNRSAKKKLADVDEKLAQLESRRGIVTEAEQLLGLMRSDPEAFIASAARHNGTTPQLFYEQMTDRRLNQGQPGSAETNRDMAALRHEIAEMKQGSADRERAATEAASKTSHEAAIADRVTQLVQVDQHEEDRNLWPHLASAPEYRRTEMANRALRFHASGKPGSKPEMLNDLKAVATTLDNYFEQEYSHVRASRGGLAGSPPGDKPNGTGQGSAASRKPRKKPPTTPGASSSGNRRPMSQEQRNDAADAALDEWGAKFRGD